MLEKNLKYLRRKHQLSQQGLSEALGIPRTTLGDYERGKTEPNINMLIKMSTYFDVNVDELLKQDLTHGEYEILKTKIMKVLAISVDGDNNGNIELVDTKAEAGYLDSYHNPEYIKDLPKIQFPNIPTGTYRGFQIQGDSMLPVEPGSIIIASYVEKLTEIKNDKTYIIVSKSEGLVYKRVRADHVSNKLILISDNDLYLPYEIPADEVDEVWQYYGHVSFSDDRKKVSSQIELQIGDIHRKVSEIHQNITS